MRSRQDPDPARARVLVVDDEALSRQMLGRMLVRLGYRVSIAADADAAFELLDRESVDAVLTDIELPKLHGFELIRRIRARDAHLPCIAITGYGGAHRSVEALRAGAFWYLEKPFDDVKVLGRLITLALQYRRHKAVMSAGGRAERFGPRTIVGESSALRRVLATAAKVAPSSATVLITGESGTGKELVARAIHEASPRAPRPLVTVNCGAMPEELLESELFGHVRGAFTGASRDREGRFQRADGGTLFLDEVGDMSPALQVKLLRVLQDGSFEPVGSSASLRAEVRVIGATNQDLGQAIREGRFRQDLFYRLNVVPLAVPPLRERREDIPALVEHVLRRAEDELGRAPTLSARALEQLCSYDWPGNVRELENLIERLAILCSGYVIDVGDLPRPLDGTGSPELPEARAPRVPDTGIHFQGVVDRFETDIIVQALERTGWNKSGAARLLGLNRTTLLEMIKKKGLEPPAGTAARYPRERHPAPAA